MACSFWSRWSLVLLLTVITVEHAACDVVIQPGYSLHGVYDTGEPPFIHEVPFDVDMGASFSDIHAVELRLVGHQDLGSASILGGGQSQPIPAAVSVELLRDGGDRTAVGDLLLPTSGRLDETIPLGTGRFPLPPDFSPLQDGRASLTASFEPPFLAAIYALQDSPVVTVDAAALIVTGGVPRGGILGDYDGDGAVYISDYLVWRDSFGQIVEPGTGADGNLGGVINVADYSVWKDRIGVSFRPTDGYLAGDFDYNGRVDAHDYVIWRNSFGDRVAPFSSADGNGDGIIDPADYFVWRDQFGQSLPGATAAIAAVPEPSALGLLVLATGLLPALSRCRRAR